VSKSIIKKHNDYLAFAKRWRRCRDVIEGQDYIHAGADMYLPRLDRQDDRQFKDYIERTRFFNASDRTVKGMLGLVFRKQPMVEPTETILEEDINHQGTTLSEYCYDILNELLIVGRVGTLVDHPAVGEATSRAQAEALNLTPQWAMYTTENIYDWSFAFVNNVYQLVRVMLFDGVDSAADSEVYKYRELILENGVYIQRLYESVDEQAEPSLVDELLPKIDGKALSYIPFYFHGIDSRQHVVDKPPMLDLFDTNIKHYQLKADHIHALHYVALPTPYVLGVDAEEAPQSIGPQRIWAISNEQATVGMLEFAGAGITSIQDELTSIESHMAQLGSRMLAPETTNKQETATAAGIRSLSENSVLAGITKRLNLQLSRIWNVTLEWAGIAFDDSAVQLNFDFMPNALPAQDLLALVTSWQSGAISKETLFYNLQQGEIIPDHLNYEDEEEIIAAELPEVINDGGSSNFGDTDEAVDSDTESESGDSE